MDDITICNILLCCHFKEIDLCIGRSKEISEGDKNISDSLGCTLCAPFLFLLYFDFICDL